MSPSDEELMLEVKGGDEEAFTELVSRYERSLISYFFRQGWDRQLAEDHAQEVFLRIFRARLDYEPRAKFRTYLFRIARNLWIDYIRSRKGGGRVLSLSQPFSESEEGGALQERLKGDGPPPSAKMRRADIREKIREAIEFLPEDQKTVFLLCEVDGMRYSDVAEMLGIPVGTVKSRMHTAMSKIRARLQKGLEKKP
ncbi:MAG: RNA polymerase sigma factor [Planctomycetota bacterium]|jgi:RNA polymerase sigma-70 factor (ECF subfamily)